MNIGFIVNNLANSEQTCEIFNLVNKISLGSNKYIPQIFFQNVLNQVLPPPCLCMNITGISNFKGKAVAFGLDSAQVLFNNNANTENWLVLWDLPWLYNSINYPVCINLMKKFKLVVRSEDHKEIVKNFTGRDDILIAKNSDELLKCLI
jgi:hypothetical protein